MTDSLFLMQRYWGSDEENAEQDKKTDPTTSQENYSSPRKKKKIDYSDSEIIEINNDVEFIEEIKNEDLSKSHIEKVQQMNEVHNKVESSKQKRKSKSKDLQERNAEFQPSAISTTKNEKDITQNFTKITIKDVSNNTKSRKKKQKINNLQLPNGESEPKISEEYSADSKGLKGILEFPKTEFKSNNANVKKDNASNEERSLKETPNQTLSSTLSETSGVVFQTIGKIQQQKDSKVKQSLPNWLNNPTYIDVDLQKEEISISELDYLDSNTKNNLQASGIEFLFPVQLSVIPWLLQSKERCLLVRPSDICVSAPTGSGKTLAFVLPIVQSLKGRVVCSIRALVVLPVNELAIQVYKVFETFIRGTDLKVVLLTGQKSFVAEQNMLVKFIGNKAQGLVDIVVTTPGRVADHMLRTKGFCLKRLRYLVIDEADRMMEEIQQGWLKQVEESVLQEVHLNECVCKGIKRLIIEPSSAYNFGFISETLQKLLYSATLTHNPEQLHSLSLFKPKLFSTSSHKSDEPFTGTCNIPETLTMMQIICDEGRKPIMICHLIKKYEFKKVLCFTESVERAHRLHLILEEMGLFEVRECSSFNRAIQRKIVFEQFVAGKIKILICSDLVARGIDIENIDCVISYDVPQFVKLYIHRIGRTARAGKNGTAITLLSEGQVPGFKRILKSAGIALPKHLDINKEELNPLVSLYQKALLAANTKLKQEKSKKPGKLSQKKKKRKKINSH